MQEVFLPVIGISAIIGVAALSVIIVRFASAFAKRLEARPPSDAPPDPAIAELREELDAMQERLDFLERTLVAQKTLGRVRAAARRAPPGPDRNHKTRRGDAYPAPRGRWRYVLRTHCAEYAACATLGGCDHGPAVGAAGAWSRRARLRGAGTRDPVPGRGIGEMEKTGGGARRRRSRVLRLRDPFIELDPVTSLARPRALLLIGASLCVPVSGLAGQTESIRAVRLHPGQTVRVRLADGQRLEARLASVDSKPVVLRFLQPQQPVPITVIDSLWLRRRATGRGALIGGIVAGGGSFAFLTVICRALSEGECDAWGTVVGLSLVGRAPVRCWERGSAVCFPHGDVLIHNG